jgi:hypothetical protein
MATGNYDPEREDRIAMEIVVDCYDDSEQAMGWYYYLQDKLRLPFKARCSVERTISPLQVGEEVEIVDLAPEEECEHEIFVLIRRKQKALGVPLAQLEPVAADARTTQAVEDWLYWVDQGY